MFTTDSVFNYSEVCQRKNVPIPPPSFADDYLVSSKTRYILGIDGKQYIFQYPNGYGASVIYGNVLQHGNTYELAVLKDGELCYDTPITDDVIPYLTEDEVRRYLDLIQKL